MNLRERIALVAASLPHMVSGFRMKWENGPTCPEVTSQGSDGLDAESGIQQGSGTVSRHILGLPARLGNGTDTGDFLILAVFLVAFLTGYAALLIDLPVPVLAILGAVSVASLAIAATATRHRFGHPAQAVPMPVPASGPTATDPGQEDDHPFPPDDTREPGLLERYWIEAPFVFIKIARKGNLGFTYTVVEPPITVREQVVLQETAAHLRKVIIYDDPDKPPAEFSEGFIHRIVREFHPEVTDERLAILSYYLRRDLSGYGPLEALMHDPALEDISCNGDDLPVFVFHRTWGSLQTNVVFGEGKLNQFVLKLAQKAKKQISLTNPLIDATLPEGSRVQVTYSNVVSLRGSSFTIRKFRTDPMTPIDLIRFGTYDAS